MVSHDPRASSRTTSPRGGFALIDLVAVAFASAVLLAIVVFLVDQARNRARAVGCRENLRKIGVALAAYSDVFNKLPVVEIAGPGLRLAHSPQALLVQYLPDQSNVAYDPKLPWFMQNAGTGAGTIATYRCPASSHRDPVDSIQARRADCPLGNLLGTTDYIVCKGPNDSWCLSNGVSGVPINERGAFEIGCPLRAADIADGQAQTIVIGEGTGGRDWLLAARDWVPFPASDAETGEPIPALNFWCWPFLNTRAERRRTNVIAAGVFGSTSTGLNSQPVTQTIVDTAKLDNCRPSSRGGVHTCSGFRSDHVGGCLFLFADGSSRFVDDGIDPGTYEALSTIAGSESVEYVD